LWACIGNRKGVDQGRIVAAENQKSHQQRHSTDKSAHYRDIRSQLFFTIVVIKLLTDEHMPYRYRSDPISDDVKREDFASTWKKEKIGLI
jgi:hypothetical protein